MYVCQRIITNALKKNSEEFRGHFKEIVQLLINCDLFKIEFGYFLKEITCLFSPNTYIIEKYYKELGEMLV